MLNMMQFQFRRLFKKSSMYICMLITAVFAFYPVSTIISSIESHLRYSANYDNFTDYTISYSSKEILTMCFAISFITLITAIFTAIFVCEDRTQGTIKTIYAKGYSRTSVFTSKYLATVAYITIYYAILLVVAIFSIFMIQLLYSSRFPEIITWDNENLLPMIVNQYLSLIAVNTLYYLISELVGKTGIGIALSIFAPIILLIILGQIYMIIRQMVGDAIDKVAETVAMYYLPTLMTGMISAFGFTSSDYNYLIAILFDLGYIVIFGGLALLVTNKQQVKG